MRTCSAIESPEAGSLSRRVLIGPNFFGAGNFGDDLMLAGFLDQLPPHSGLSIDAFTPHDIESQRRRFPQVTWARDDDAARERAIAEADVWLSLGSTPFQLDSGPWMLDHLSRERERCARFKVPMVYLGAGCESEEVVRDFRAKALVAASTRLWTRDALSATYLTDAVPSATVEIGADLAHLEFEVGITPKIETGMLGLVIAYELAGLVPERAIEDLIDRRAPDSTRWLIQEERNFRYTERWNFDALSASAQQQLNVMALDYGRDSIETFLDNFGAPDVVVSTRYHGALVASWHGSRVAVVARSPKLRAIAEDLDLPWTDAIASADDLRLLIERARGARHDRLERQRARAAAMCTAFFDWLETATRAR